jgi:integrase
VKLELRGKVWHYDFGADGRRFRGSTKETSKVRAERKALAVMAQVRQGDETHKKAPRLADFEPRFTKAIQASSLKPATKRYYKMGWRLLKDTGLGEMRINRITRDQADAITIIGSDSYRGQALRTLRVMLGKAAEWGIIPLAPKIKLPKRTQRHAVISGEQEQALLAHAHPKLKLAYLMIQDAGLRPEEISRSRIELINWQARTYFNAEGKTEKSRRHVPLSQRLFDALFVHVGARKDGWLFPAKKAKSGHVHPDSLSHWFNDARVDAGLPADIVLYSARHTFATDALSGSGNVAAVMNAMGHTDARMLMGYQHPELEQVRVAIDRRNAANTSQALAASRLTN